MKRPLALASTALVLSLAAAAASGCTAGGRDIPDPVGVARETTETSVFYSTGRTLIEEVKVVDARDPYKATLDKLLAAEPSTNEEVAIVQPDAKVRSAKLSGDTVTVDWDRAVLDFDATDQEKVLAFASVLQTLGQFPEVRYARFTVEGRTSGLIGGKDIEKFWGRISLKGQPFKVLRLQGRAGSSDATPTKAAGSSK